MKDKVNIDQTINRAVREAIREYDKEKRMSQRDKRPHNIRLLMKNYNRLKEHIENVSDDIESTNEDIEFDFDSKDDEVWIASIIRTRNLSFTILRIKQLKNIWFNINITSYKFSISFYI